MLHGRSIVLHTRSRSRKFLLCPIYYLHCYVVMCPGRLHNMPWGCRDTGHLGRAKCPVSVSELRGHSYHAQGLAVSIAWCSDNGHASQQFQRVSDCALLTTASCELPRWWHWHDDERHHEVPSRVVASTTQHLFRDIDLRPAACTTTRDLWFGTISYLPTRLDTFSTSQQRVSRDPA